MTFERELRRMRHGPGREFARYHHGPGSGYRRQQRYLARRRVHTTTGEHGEPTGGTQPLQREDLQGTWAMEREATLTASLITE